MIFEKEARESMLTSDTFFRLVRIQLRLAAVSQEASTFAPTASHCTAAAATATTLQAATTNCVCLATFTVPVALTCYHRLLGLSLRP